MSIGKRNEGNLKAQIYTKIFEDIIRGEYGPEDVLREKALVEKFHVSKSPVREALIELCKEGVLRSIPRYGYESFVSQIGMSRKFGAIASSLSVDVLRLIGTC